MAEEKAKAKKTRERREREHTRPDVKADTASADVEQNDAPVIEGEVAERGSDNPSSTPGRSDKWQERASFNVAFDSLKGERASWRTRVYHEESDEREQWDGIAGEDLLRWMQATGELPPPPPAEQPDSPHKTAPESGAAPTIPPDETDTVNWKQYASFALSFETTTDASGATTWRTRLYDAKTGETATIAEVTSGVWSRWVIEHAQIPADVIEQHEPDVHPAPDELLGVSNSQIDILDVTVSKQEGAPGQSADRLVAEAQFRLASDQIGDAQIERLPCLIEMHAVAVDGGASRLLASAREQLRQEGEIFVSRQEFPIPDIGRYELHTLIVALPPYDMMAFYEGPIINVVA